MPWAGAFRHPPRRRLGPLFDDEGSAHWIGRAALALASQHLDGRKPPSGFAHGLLGEMGVASEDLLGWTYGRDTRAGLASVAALDAPLRCSFAGGAMQDATLMATLSAALGPPVPPVLPPVGGAALAAAKTAGWTIGPVFITTLQTELTKSATPQ